MTLRIFGKASKLHYFIVSTICIIPGKPPCLFIFEFCHDCVFHLIKRRRTCRPYIIQPYYVPAELRKHRPFHLAHLHREHRVIKWLRHLAPCKKTKVSTLFCACRIFRKLPGKGLEVFALFDAVHYPLGLFLYLFNLCLTGVCRYF